MGFANCFPKEDRKQIYIVFTDTLKKDGSVLLSLGVNKNDTSVQELSKYLDDNHTVKSVSESEQQNDIAELCQIIDGKREGTVGKAVDNTKTRPYSGREWLTFISVCVVMTTNISIVHAFGTLFPFILSEFGENRAAAATVQSVLFGVGLCSGFIIGSIVQHFGPCLCGIVGSTLFSVGFISSYFATSTLHLVLSCGVVSGLGFSFLTISSNQAASLCFEGQARLIGLSVVSSAIGIGGMVYPYLLTWMVDTYGLKGTFLLMGGITLNGIPMAFLWKHLNEHTKRKNASEIKPINFGELYTLLLSRVKETMKFKPFLATLIGFALAMPSVNMFEILALDVLESNGLTRSISVIMFVILNAVSIPGRLVPGFIKRVHGLSSMMAPVLGALISGLGMLLINATKTLAGSGIACAALGLSKGILLSSVQIIVLELLDTMKFSVGLGIIFGLVGLCTTALGPLNGLVRDASGSYSLSLYSAAATMLVSLCLFRASMVLNSMTKARKLRQRSISVFTVTRF